MLRAPVERQMMNGADELKTVSWIQSGEESVIFNRAMLDRSTFRKLEDKRQKGKLQESRHSAVEILHLCRSHQETQRAPRYWGVPNLNAAALL